MDQRRSGADLLQKRPLIVLAGRPSDEDTKTDVDRRTPRSDAGTSGDAPTVRGGDLTLANAERCRHHARAFNANPGDPTLGENTVRKAAPLVGSVTQPETAKLGPTRNPEYQTGSSQYASATSEAESDSSVDLQRMALGPSGAETLREREANTKPDRFPHEPTPMAAPAVTSRSSEQMQTFFNAAMNRYLKEKQTEESTPTAGRHTMNNQDVEMESVESHHDSHGEQPTPGQAVIASAGPISAPSTTTPRIRGSAISELKEYSGKDHDADRARSWLDKVKSVFVRDQAPDSAKCTWRYPHWTGTQLVPVVESINEEQLEELLLRLNVAGLRAKLLIKDEPLATRCEHVEHFIETLDDRELADQLTLLRLTNPEDLEETLWARQRAKARQGKTHVGTNKFRQKAAPEPPSASSKNTRAVRVIRQKTAASGNRMRVLRIKKTNVPGGSQEPGEPHDHADAQRRHSRSSHNVTEELHRLRINEARQPGLLEAADVPEVRQEGASIRSLPFRLSRMREMHEPGKCPLEEFYNLIHQWYLLNKHAEMLPANAEKMLN
ncbi:LOW QUALITY PROTEIN: hypothetical protein PHMEG_0006243 [Phytophthora megakarya]|uniref:Uncharacterized protein n=1 Tax=Phytophthora megakarya TaxID=4795 RepID=A0A225WQJ1_9STRA|nr:LOW QUALITY PROTEIN: hypothetical protein PHMEG_0006243 [Phytophthora megakarya]